MRAKTIAVLLLGVCSYQAAAFRLPSSVVNRRSHESAIYASETAYDTDDTSPGVSRRLFVDDLMKGSIGITLAYLSSSPANASGGATAGGAYLLSGTVHLVDTETLLSKVLLDCSYFSPFSVV